MNRDQIEHKISEAQARLDVVNDILSFETHPAELRRYKMERGRIKSRIKAYQRELKAIEHRETFGQLTNQELFDGRAEAVTHSGNWQGYEKEIRKRGLGWKLDQLSA